MTNTSSLKLLCFHIQFTNGGNNIKEILLRHFCVLVNTLKNNPLVSIFCFPYSFLKGAAFHYLQNYLVLDRQKNVRDFLIRNLGRNKTFKHLQNTMRLHISIFCI